MIWKQAGPVLLLLRLRCYSDCVRFMRLLCVNNCTNVASLARLFSLFFEFPLHMTEPLPLGVVSIITTTSTSTIITTITIILTIKPSALPLFLGQGQRIAGRVGFRF
jgi:hypothetical protein